MRPRGIQESLHHRDVATALWIRARGYAGNGADGADDAGAGPDGAADRAGHEGVGSAASYNPFDRSARRAARHSKGKTPPAPAPVEGKEAAEEACAARHQAAGLSGEASHEFARRGLLMSFLSTGIAVLTGAGSGIGRALAQQLAAAGSALALADIDEPGLKQTVESLGGTSAAVSTHLVDVAEEASVSAFAEDVAGRHGRVTLLINNAGVSLHGDFEEISLDDFRWLMNINFWGTVYGTNYFLPILKREKRAHIVNLSSVFGIIAPAGQAPYAASKFAVRGFTEALRHELEGSNVGVSCVHPGGIKTPIARRSRIGAGASASKREENIERFDRLARTPPEKAAERILRGVERGEPRILIGSDAYQIDILQRLRPASYWKTLSEKFEKLAAKSK